MWRVVGGLEYGGVHKLGPKVALIRQQQVTPRGEGSSMIAQAVGSGT